MSINSSENRKFSCDLIVFTSSSYEIRNTILDIIPARPMLKVPKLSCCFFLNSTQNIFHQTVVVEELNKKITAGYKLRRKKPLYL